jgi:hypothetical protein
MGLVGIILFGVGALMVMVGVGLVFFGVEGASFVGIEATFSDSFDGFEVVCEVLPLVRPEKWREMDCLRVFIMVSMAKIGI